MTALSHSHIITGACTCALTFKFLHERHWLAIVLCQEALRTTQRTRVHCDINGKAAANRSSPN